MSVPIVRSLILKDLYLVRWLIAGSIAAGLAALTLMPLSRASAYVGAVSLICVLIVLNIFLVMHGVVQERKEKVVLFILSLPASTTHYTIAKVAAMTIAFVGPWLVLTIGTIVMVTVSRVPDGVLPFWLAVLGYLLFYACALLGVSLVTDSIAWHSTAIIIGNVSVNFVIPFVFSRPSVSAYAEGPTAVWSPDIVAIIAIETVAGFAALALAAYVRARRPDFV